MNDSGKTYLTDQDLNDQECVVHDHGEALDRKQDHGEALEPKVNTQGQTTMILTDDKQDYIILCPHCGQLAICHVNQIACRIFTCGVFKSNFEQINPHMPREIAMKMKEDGIIYGCGLQYIVDVATMTVVKCSGL